MNEKRTLGHVALDLRAATSVLRNACIIASQMMNYEGDFAASELAQAITLLRTATARFERYGDLEAGNCELEAGKSAK